MLDLLLGDLRTKARTITQSFFGSGIGPVLVVEKNIKPK